MINNSANQNVQQSSAASTPTIVQNQITSANTAAANVQQIHHHHHIQVSTPTIQQASAGGGTAAVVAVQASNNPHAQVKTRKETLEAKRERKAAKTLAIITGAFVVCWLPFFLMALLMPLCESCYINDKIAAFFLWMGYFNSTLNPVIYTIFSPEFRQAFKRILFGTHRSGYYRGGKL